MHQSEKLQLALASISLSYSRAVLHAAYKADRFLPTCLSSLASNGRFHPGVTSWCNLWCFLPHFRSQVCNDCFQWLSCSVVVQAGSVVEVRKGKLRLGSLAADVQALRDVKHFVKDYKGHLLSPLPPSGMLTFQNSPAPVELLLL